MIIEVKTKKQLKDFVYFVKDLYKDCKHYIYPIFYVLNKELKLYVLKKKSYKALLYVDNNQVKGRLLYTFEKNHKLGKKVCYFSYFDAYEEQIIFNQLFAYMESDMRGHGVEYSEGTFTPYDPDNRRGVLIQGYSDDPIIFTSYNYSYYQSLFESYGYKKSHDTYSLQPKINEKNKKRLNTLSEYFERRFAIKVDPIDLKNIEKEISDIHEILMEATTEVIYQEAPSIDLIRDVAKNLKMFLEPKIILIAREIDTNKPVGFTFCMLDYNQIFKQTNGKLNLYKLIFGKKKINRSRGMMQYVIPKYQGSGLIGYMYKKVYDAFEQIGVTKFEAGTIMENNQKPLTAMNKFGAEISKIYRIYGKEI